MKGKRSKKAPAPPKPPILADEKEQIRIRRKQGFPLISDEFGRDRVPTETADGQRRFDRSSTGIVRLRLSDPLRDVTGLSPRQRNAGLRFRSDYEIAATSGIKPGSLDERIDASGAVRDMPAQIIQAFTAVGKAREALGHHEIVMVVENVCGLRMSIREIAERTRDPRPALVKLLKIGLDHLADHYFGEVRIRDRVIAHRSR